MTTRRSLVPLVLFVALVPAGVRAEEEGRRTFLSAPFASADAQATCFDAAGIAGRCAVQTATADGESGHFDIDLQQQGREGTGPGVALGEASATFVAHHVRSVPAAALLVVATIQADEVLTGIDGGISSVLSAASVDAEMSVAHASCATCAETVVRTVSSATEPVGSGTISLLGVLVDPTGAPLSAGALSVEVRVRATTRLLGLGEARARVAGAVTQIEIAAPSAERVLAAPYAGASVDRSCTGSVGTTFGCRTAAARSTGRLEMDLSVTSPIAGSAPGSGSALGGASIRLDDTPLEAVRATVYVAELQIISADAFTHPTTPVIGAAGAGISSDAWVTGPCETCTRGAFAPIVGAGEGTSRLDDLVPLVVWTRQDADAGAQEPATMQIVVNGASFIQHSAGIASTSLRSVVSSVRAIEIA